MKAETGNKAAAEKAKAKPERDAKGRFVKGNKGGPGNPFARQVALLRATMVYCVPPERMARVVIALTEKAASGDVAAMKLFFQYLIGLPTEAVNPDRLPIDEWEKFRDAAIKPEEIGEILDRCPVTAASDMVKECWAASAERNFEEALKEHAEIEAQVAEDEGYMEELEKAEQAARQTEVEPVQPAPKPPSTNGPTVESAPKQTPRQPHSYRHAAPKTANYDHAPSPNRDIGMANRNAWRDIGRRVAESEDSEDDEFTQYFRNLLHPSPNGRTEATHAGEP
jgi:hypothetical protein